MNVSDRHLAFRVENPRRVEDLHFRIRGPIVAELQRVFNDDWRFVTGEKLEGDRFHPELGHAGTALCRGVSDGPNQDQEKVRYIILGAIACARRGSDPDPVLHPRPGDAGGSRHGGPPRGAGGNRAPGEEQFAPPPVGLDGLPLGAAPLRRAGVPRAPSLRPHESAGDGRNLGSDRVSEPGSPESPPELRVQRGGLRFRPWAAGWEPKSMPAAARSRAVTLEEVDSRTLPVRLRDGVAKLFSSYLSVFRWNFCPICGGVWRRSMSFRCLVLASPPLREETADCADPADWPEGVRGRDRKDRGGEGSDAWAPSRVRSAASRPPSHGPIDLRNLRNLWFLFSLVSADGRLRLEFRHFRPARPGRKAPESSLGAGTEAFRGAWRSLLPPRILPPRPGRDR